MRVTVSLIRIVEFEFFDVVVAEHVPMPAIDAAPIEEGAPVVSAIVDTVVDADGTLDSAEEKRLKRMRRNRESAAQSRNRSFA